MPRYKVTLSGNAWVDTIYYGDAADPEEAEAKARRGDFACSGQEVRDEEDTYAEVIDEDDDEEETAH